MTFMRSPAFQFYPSNYLGSRAVRLMDAEQRGWYTQLLFESWESDPQATLPNDDTLLRVLAGVNTCSADVEQRWNFVKAQFKVKGKLVYNSRLLEEVVKQDENREKKRAAGQASGEARRAQREIVKNQHLNGGTKRNTRSTVVDFRSDSVRTEDEQKRTLNTHTQSPTPVPDSTLKEEKIPSPKNGDGADDFNIWNLGVKYVVSCDHISVQTARSFFGEQIKHYGKPAVARAAIEAISCDAVEPRGYIVQVLKGAGRAGPKSKVDHSMDAVRQVLAEKEAQRDAVN